jgi:hypothetical protein
MTPEQIAARWAKLDEPAREEWLKQLLTENDRATLGVLLSPLGPPDESPEALEQAKHRILRDVLAREDYPFLATLLFEWYGHRIHTATDDPMAWFMAYLGGRYRSARPGTTERRLLGELAALALHHWQRPPYLRNVRFD